jgi:hypothetical protein
VFLSSSFFQREGGRFQAFSKYKKRKEKKKEKKE